MKFTGEGQSDRDRFLWRGFIRKASVPVLASLTLVACSKSNHISSSTENSVPTATGSADSSSLTFRSPSNKVFLENSDNHQGVAVFSSPEGAAVPDNVPGRIPYGTQVEVACVAPNFSGMSSVNDFYLVKSNPWQAMFAVADSFANGGSMGPNSINVDPKVPDCIS